MPTLPAFTLFMLIIVSNSQCSTQCSPPPIPVCSRSLMGGVVHVLNIASTSFSLCSIQCSPPPIPLLTVAFEWGCGDRKQRAIL